MQWETVIGLEVHVQLATQSKIFSGASTNFGAEPNAQACAIDLAMPGMLPVLNEGAVRMAVKFGLAVNADIAHRSVFDRKNYFYADLPKGYQISQMYYPIVGKGEVSINLPDNSTRTVGIHHAHMEEDAGKSLHEDFHGQTGIDLNRAGTPLLEIVSEPDMRSAEEAAAYLRKIHAIVTYLGISDGDMSQGSMRCDCNVSVRPVGQEEFGTRAEIKNVNSFRFVEKAINAEAERQIELIEDGGVVEQETRLYDADHNETRSMRTKEFANDYRYFPDPDLLPVEIDDDTINDIRSELPELPDEKQARFTSDYGLSEAEAAPLVQSQDIANYFETVAKASGDARQAANWIMGELARLMNQNDITIDQCPVTAESLATLIGRIQDGTISSKIAKQVFEALWNGEGTTDDIIENQGLKQVSDSGEIENLVDQILSENPEMVEDYLGEDVAKKQKKKFNALVGEVMKASQGKANPAQVNDILQSKLSKD
jgi:aspartyl-tRNA(Asn)/glutamyl-tRNA(Gln) amidotransferase subunit B